MSTDINEKKEQSLILKTCITTAFITTFMGSALNLAIPNIGSHFQVSAATVGWIVTGYMLSVATFSVPFGKIADTTGRRRVFLLGIAGFALSGMLSAFSINMGMMIFTRIIQGITGAMIFATNTAILIAAFPSYERGKILGKMTASTYIGLAAGPVIGGILNHYVGWQAIFIVSFLVSTFAFVVAIKSLPKRESLLQEKKKDIVGSLLYILMIIITMFGFSNITVMKYSWILLVVGLIIGVIFVKVELVSENPLVKVRIFVHNTTYTLSNVAALLNYGATFAIGYLMSIYLQVVMGYSSQIAGLILIVQPVVMACVSPISGRMSDKVAPYKLASLGMGLCAVSLLIFLFVGLKTPLMVIIVALIFAGVGFGVFSSPNTNAIMACVGKEDYSIASSILATMRTLGHTVSMAIVTVVISFYMGKSALSAAEPEILVQTMHAGFIVFICLCVVGVFMSLKRKSKN